MNIFKKRIIDSLKKHIKVEESSIEVPPDPGFGDYAIPCFSFAKVLKKNPNQIAGELKKKVKKDDIIIDVKNIGPYLNFYINNIRLSEHVLKIIFKYKNNFGKTKDKKIIMVEYSSPNTNKPLHLGHIRNIVIGKSLSNIYLFKGNRIIQSCLVNDRGIHISKSMLAYQKWGKNKPPDKKSDHFVGDYYVLFNKNLKKNPGLEAGAQELLRKWEKKEKDVMSLWKTMNKWAEEGFIETYKSLGIRFDRYYHESKIYNKGKSIVEDGFKKGKFKKIDGAITAELEKFKLPDKVLMRADGTTLYMTQDIYLAIKKFDDYSLDKSIYVVGSEQKMHFAQLFKILELLGNKKVKDCHHLSYGMVYLPEGRMKSREGTVVDADDIINDMQNLAEKEIKKRHKKLSEKEVKRRAEIIGLGALKFFMLRTDPGKDMTFDPKESISFEGETGPYVQYVYARIASIQRKYGKRINDKVDFEALGDDEKPLIKLLFNFPDIVKEAANYKPSIICRYLLDLSQEFNEYYHKIPILNAEKEQMLARLLLISCIKEVIKSGLNLLDIDVLGEM